MVLKLSKHLEKVIVLNRSWESAVTPTILGDTDSSPSSIRAVFLDLPCLTVNRHSRLYQSDCEDTAEKAACDSYEWAVSRGDDPNYKIAYCCAEGNVDILPGWSSISQVFSGIRTLNATASAGMPSCSRTHAFQSRYSNHYSECLRNLNSCQHAWESRAKHLPGSCSAGNV